MLVLFEMLKLVRSHCRMRSFP